MQLSKEPNKIKEMFAAVAPNYDRTNTVLSLGIHHRWKKLLVEKVAAGLPKHVLDCATGTGDIAIELKREIPTAKVIGIDFCAEMVAFAPAKALAAGVGVDFQVQDITQLTFADQSFDAVTISFGIRNVNDTARGISEMNRVLRPGGKLFILEFGRPRPELFAVAYDFYTKKCLPTIGGLFSGQKSAYEYLQKSSSVFPSGDCFVDAFLNGPEFQDADASPLSFGIANIYSAVKA